MFVWKLEYYNCVIFTCAYYYLQFGLGDRANTLEKSDFEYTVLHESEQEANAVMA